SHPVDHAVAGDSLRVGVDVQGIPHYPRPAGIPRQAGHMAVGADLSPRDTGNNGINFVKGIFRRRHTVFSLPKAEPFPPAFAHSCTPLRAFSGLYSSDA